MKKGLLIFLAAGLLAVCTVGSAYAKEEIVVVSQGEKEYRSINEQKKGFVTTIGPMLGFEMSALKQVVGGVISGVGYRFNNRYSLLLQTEFLYSKKYNVNYYIFPVVPVLNVHFDTDFILLAGGGYTYMYATTGRKFSSQVSTRSKGYNGWTAIAGGGYEFWMTKNFSLVPQIMFTYTRIDRSNAILPLARLDCRWIF